MNSDNRAASTVSLQSGKSILNLNGIVALLLVMLGLYVARAIYLDIARQKQEVLSLAIKVKDFALNRFGEIDLDHNNIIVEGELDKALEKFNDEERELLMFLRAQSSLAGHQVVSVEYSPVSVMVGRTQVVVNQRAKVTTYEIDRNDLAVFPQRVKARMDQ